MVQLHLANHVAQRGLRELLDRVREVRDLVGRAHGMGDLGIDQRIDLHHHVILSDHVLAREHVHRFPQVDLVGPEMASERFARRRHDHLVPVDVARLVQPRHDQIQPRGQRPVVFPQPLDHHRLRLLDDADALGDGDDHEQRDRAKENQSWIHDSGSLSTMSVVPSTWTTITRVPGSSTAWSTDAPRQFSPSTITRPERAPPSIRSVTTPVLPSSASTLVRTPVPDSSRKCRRRNGRIPTRLARVVAAKAITWPVSPTGARPTSPAAKHPMATQASQNPGANISATSSNTPTTVQ